MMNTVKSSGLRMPGRAPKHSGQVVRSSTGGSSSPVVPKESTPLKPLTPPKFSEEGDDVLGDYTVGESVWVNGVKAGTIAYLGETQFAPGQWAGVILSDPVGKNDGSVGGVRYFECPALQGIFTRPSKLTRQPAAEGPDGPDPTQPQHETNSTPSAQRVVVPLREGLLNSAVKTGNESGSNMSDSGSAKRGGEKDLRVGDRVLVGGSKMGVIRYMGETDFAKGEWCGVELDEPLGKNDGAVAGTRYFQCLPKFGLFAPIHKVIRIGFPSTSPAKVKKSKRMAMGVSSLAHSPSSSSISSVSSVASSVGGRPSRAGLLTETSSRYARKISGTTALQEALKEKQQHIEQLLAERDLERAEVAKANSHICEVEKELSTLKASHMQYVTDNERTLLQVQTLLASTQKDKQELINQLEEEKRKVEDLQFRVEEECIFKGDLEQTTVEEQSRIMQLEKELGLKKAELERAQAQLRGPNQEPRDQEEPSDQGEQRASSPRTDTQELANLRGLVARQNQELSDLKQKIQQVNKENMDMMDTWKVKFNALAIDHEKSWEELKSSLKSPPSALSGQEPDAQELLVCVESMKMEHQLEMENLKAKHKIEAAILSKERDDLSLRLQEAWKQLENRITEGTEEDHTGQYILKQALSDTRERLQKAEQQLQEGKRLQEELREERERSEDVLRRSLDQRSSELEALQQAHTHSLDTVRRLEQELSERLESQVLPEDYNHSRDTIHRLEEELRVTTNQLQALQAQHTSQEANVIEDHDTSEEKMNPKHNIQETTEKLMKREKEVSALISQVEVLKSQVTALEGKVSAGERKAELLLKEKMRIEAELDSISRKSHDASGQLVSISQELLKKERSLNELRVLLLETHRPPREEREVCKAEWRVKEQKLQDDIKSLREKLLLLGQQRSSPDHRRYSMLEPSALDSEVSRLRQRLLSTEDALRNALEHNQNVDLLVQAMCRKPDKTQTHEAHSANGIHCETNTNKHEHL
ncbi:CAP-Gly domain-containing linker protein 2 [Periophthalmus magnuspinnatus]|uniref:CAP-Gly domain-containing linker protein 2 n=1 Tax=Periophthalmus magnuspinnatus TaxID=409849 RepID=UPI0024365D2B|nr:CAP-Gly domain-containing linker protein 2 [Periophthalmus magnuspinnatus]